MERGDGIRRETGWVPAEIEDLVSYGEDPRIAALEARARDPGVIHLASNENPLGPSPLALQAAHAAAAACHRYPDPMCTELRAALAEQHGVSAEEIVVGNGSVEMLDVLVRTVCRARSDDEVLSSTPSFRPYSSSPAMHGVRPVTVPLRDDHAYDVDGLLRAVGPRTRLLFLANPNTPTGTYLGRDELVSLARALPPRVVLAVDETYFHFANAPDYVSALDIRGHHEGLVVVRSFSKIYGLAAMRVGYLVGHPGIARHVQRVRPTFNVNRIAQEAARAALGDLQHVEQSRRLVQQGRCYIARELAALGLPPVPTQGNFVFFEARGRADFLFSQLLRQGILIRPFGVEHLRASTGTLQQNRRLIHSLGQLMRDGVC